MFKTLSKIINFKTLFLALIYIFLKKEDKSFTTYEIKEDSMSPELQNEDYVIAVNPKENLTRGDIVIFKNTEKNIEVIKRVVGLPNEIVSSSEGTVLINSEKLNDPWAQTSTNDFIETKLSSDEIFVLGDQRQLSTSDSRTLGAVKISECKKLKYRYFPFHRVKSYE